MYDWHEPSVESLSALLFHIAHVESTSDRPLVEPTAPLVTFNAEGASVWGLANLALTVTNVDRTLSEVFEDLCSVD